MRAEGERDHGDGDEQADVRAGHERDGEHDEGDQGTHVEDVLAGQRQRVRLDPRGQLQIRDDRAGESDGADEHTDEHLGVMDAQQRTAELLTAVASGVDVEVAVPADERGGEADEAVHDGDQLGHAGHLDDPGAPQSDARADGRGDGDQHETGGGDAPGGETDGGGQRDDHARDAPDDSRAGGPVLREAGQAEDEQQRGDDVGGLCGRDCGHP